MTNELEKQFFRCFGIEAKEEKYCYWECKKPELENVACNNTECEHYRHKIHYPQITDRILLELICILSKSKAFYSNFYKIQDVNIEQLKEQVLTNCISKSIYFKRQVRTLFEEG